jgi:hypothetical protein
MNISTWRSISLTSKVSTGTKAPHSNKSKINILSGSPGTVLQNLNMAKLLLLVIDIVIKYA